MTDRNTRTPHADAFAVQPKPAPSKSEIIRAINAMQPEDLVDLHDAIALRSLELRRARTDYRRIQL